MKDDEKLEKSELSSWKPEWVEENNEIEDETSSSTQNESDLFHTN